MRSASESTIFGLVGDSATANLNGDTGASKSPPCVLCGAGDATSNEISINLELDGCGSTSGDDERSGGRSENFGGGEGLSCAREIFSASAEDGSGSSAQVFSDRKPDERRAMHTVLHSVSVLE